MGNWTYFYVLTPLWIEYQFGNYWNLIVWWKYKSDPKFGYGIRRHLDLGFHENNSNKAKSGAPVNLPNISLYTFALEDNIELIILLLNNDCQIWNYSIILLIILIGDQPIPFHSIGKWLRNAVVIDVISMRCLR